MISEVSNASFWDVMVGEVLGKGKPAMRRRALVVYVLWHLWQARNDLAFEGRLKRPQTVRRNAEQEFEFILGCQRVECGCAAGW